MKEDPHVFYTGDRNVWPGVDRDMNRLQEWRETSQRYACGRAVE